MVRWLYGGFFMGMRQSLYSVVAILLAAKCCFAYTGPNPRNSNIKAGTVKLDRCWNLTFDHDYIAGDNDEDLCLRIRIWVLCTKA